MMKKNEKKNYSIYNKKEMKSCTKEVIFPNSNLVRSEDLDK